MFYHQRSVRLMGTKQTKQSKHSKENTPTFLLELPLEVEAGQARRLRSHLEAGRQFYNAVLSEGQRRLRRMKADPAWGAAQALPRTRPLERRAALSALRQQHGFFHHALQRFATEQRVSSVAHHPHGVPAPTPARRARR